MPGRSDEITQAAVNWLIRLREAKADEWAEFTDWLEADPRHSEIFDEVSLAEGSIVGLPPATAMAVTSHVEVPTKRRFHRRAVVGWSMAAAAVAGLMGFGSFGSSPDLYQAETAPGERRVIALSDSSRVELNGGTRLVLDRDNPRWARLTVGEALFSVAKDPAHGFRLEAGGTDVRVVGTVFNVVSQGGDLDVAVSEGIVIVNLPGGPTRLTQGMALERDSRETRILTREVGDIGAWRQSRLAYIEAPLSRIASDLTRNIGVPVDVGEDLGRRTFTGVIALDADRDLLFQRVSALLEVRARRNGRGWMLTPGTDARR